MLNTRKVVLGALTALLIVNQGCSLFHSNKKAKPTVFVPDFETAQEQYSFAMQVRMESFPSQDPLVRQKRRARIYAAFEKVIELFPDAALVAAGAKLNICELCIEDENYEKALRLATDLRALIDADIDAGRESLELIDAMALYNQATCLENLNRTLEAQEAFRQCRDRYIDSEDKEVKAVAHKAKIKFERIVDLDDEEEGDSGGFRLWPF